ncbi:hypothetical protein Tco_1454415 [Tanacetum coccineum]
MSFDNLYNNFKIIEQEVKRTASSSSSSSSQNMAFMSSPSSTNEDNTAYEVSTAYTQVSTTSTQKLLPKPWWLLMELVLTGAIWQMKKSLQTWLLWLFKTLRIDFNKSEFNLATYKRGLASVEEQLIFYKKNEVIFFEQLVVLKIDISYKDSVISMLKRELEKLKQENESNQLKIENFGNASKSLDKLIGSQIPDKSRKGVGFVSYNTVPPSLTGLFSPPKFDLSNSVLEEFQQPEFEGYGPKTSKSVSENFSKEVRESPDTPLVEKLVSDDKLEKKTGSPTVAKIEFVRPKQQEKPVRKPVKYAEMYSFDHVQANYNYHQRERVVSGNSYTRVNYNYLAKKAYPSAHKNMVPREILMKTGLRSLNTARPVNTAHPTTTVYSARPMPKAVNTVRPNSTIVNVVREIRVIHKKKIKAMLIVDAQGT